jgi:hypothetical protein
MSYYDNRPGFNSGNRITGYTEKSYKRRKPFDGVIERQFVVWTVLERKHFKTEEEAQTWVTDRLNELTNWHESRDRKYV